LTHLRRALIYAPTATRRVAYFPVFGKHLRRHGARALDSFDFFRAESPAEGAAGGAATALACTADRDR
jgi:hypothetical protein